MTPNPAGDEPMSEQVDEPDEEMVPHAFEPREPGGDDDEEGPIWCMGCEYHRDHLIHQETSR